MTTTQSVRTEFARLRSLGFRAEDAYKGAQVHAKFRLFAEHDLVRLRVEPDFLSYDISYVDTWEDISDAKRERIKANIQRRVDTEGVWAVVVEYQHPVTKTWEFVSSVGGFIGEDWRDSYYDTGLMTEALLAYAQACLEAIPSD